MNGLSGIGLLTSFGAGVISFLSPCVLPLVPGYVSYVAGEALGVTGEPIRPLAALRLSLCFVLGFSTVFVILGASATSIGQLLLSYRYEANLIGGAVVTLLGLFMMGLARLPWLQREFRLHVNLGGGRPVAAYIIGIAFAFGWTPCIGPVLGALLTTSAVSATVPQGIALLSFYSIGLGLPFLAAAIFTDSLMMRLRAFRRLGRTLQLGAGAIVAGMGVVMLTGEMTSVSYWLLDTFPIPARTRVIRWREMMQSIEIAKPPSGSPTHDRTGVYRSWSGNRRVLAVAGFAVSATGLGLGWDWLTAIGIAPLVVSAAPCLIMCAFGLCMMGRKSSALFKPAQAGSRGTAYAGRPVDHV